MSKLGVVNERARDNNHGEEGQEVNHQVGDHGAAWLSVFVHLELRHGLAGQFQHSEHPQDPQDSQHSGGLEGCDVGHLQVGGQDG